jgi:DNA (cytosine-5)-methyltransferase 1
MQSLLTYIDGLLCELEGKDAKALSGVNLTHGSLFSGAGGFELGAHKAGIQTLWSCEIEPDCRGLLKNYFPQTKQYSNIVSMNNPAYVDIISGGFPCQDISIANNRNNDTKTKGIKGERSGLWCEMYRIISQVKPKYVIIENSPLLTKRGLEYVIQDLSKIGYCIEWQTLSARMFGYPHIRRRFYAIAYPKPSGCAGSYEVFAELQKILPKEAPRQNILPGNFERFNASSNFNRVRINNEFSEKLDERHRRTIEMMGNAAMPVITEYLFNAINNHNERVSKC